jgi:hypothetical protein
MIDRDPSAHSMTVAPGTSVDVAGLIARNRRLSEEIREQRRLADDVEDDRDKLAERVKAMEAQRLRWQVEAVERSRTIAELERELGEARRHLSPPVADEDAPRIEPYRPRPVVNVKPRPDLLPAEALLEAGACLADRTDRDVAELPWFDRAPLSETLPKYRASFARHALAYLAHELVDPTSTRATLAHVITNAAILYRLENRAVLAARANAATTSKG